MQETQWTSGLNSQELKVARQHSKRELKIPINMFNIIEGIKMIKYHTQKKSRCEKKSNKKSQE